MAKELKFNSEARNELFRGVEKLAAAVTATCIPQQIAKMFLTFF